MPEPKAAAPELTALAEKAVVLYWEGKYEEALAVADEALARDPRFIRAYAARVINLLQLGKTEEGIASARAALAIAPTDGLIYSVLAMCYARLGDDEAAVANFERSLALWPNESRVYYNFACYWAQLGNAGECRRTLEVAFMLDTALVELAGRDPDLARFAYEDWFRDLIAQYKTKRLKERRR